jgi:hypothetical protein
MSGKKTVMTKTSETSAQESISTRLSLAYYFKLLLIVTFPLHVWALIMVFRDLEFVSERTELWDGIGYAGYSLMFTLFESLILTLIVWLLTLLLPKKWTTQRTLSIAGSLFLILAIASIIDMAFHAFNEVRLSKQYLHGLATYPALTYAFITGAIVVTMAAVVWVIVKSRRGEKLFAEIFDRVMLLSYFYLFLDVVGLVIVILRNVSETL